jgi:hypothetical protein
MKIFVRILHRLRHERVRGEMHHRIGPGGFDRQRNQFGIKEITLHKGRSVINRIAVALRQIVKNNDLVSSLKQFFSADASDVARAPCNKNFQTLKSHFFLLLDQSITSLVGLTVRNRRAFLIKVRFLNDQSRMIKHKSGRRRTHDSRMAQ